MDEYCSGAVLFTSINDVLYYVVVAEEDGHYGLPKGHLEPGESELTAALREVREETGLCPQIIEGFRIRTQYPSINGCTKFVTFFLAYFPAQKTICYNREELTGAELLPFAEAYVKIKHQQVKEVLNQANRFLYDIK